MVRTVYGACEDGGKRSRIDSRNFYKFFSGRGPWLVGTSRAESPSGRRRDEAARDHDDPLTVLLLDRLHPAKAGKHAIAGDLEEVAVPIFDKRIAAAAHAVEDPIREDLCFSQSRWTVENCAGSFRDLGSRCRRRSHALSLLLQPIDGFSDTSKLHIWLSLRTLDAIEAIGQPGELIIDVAGRAFDIRVCTENSNSDIMVMQSAKDRVGMDTSSSLNWARERRVLI
jgi:hypothetical protein